MVVARPTLVLRPRVGHGLRGAVVNNSSSTLFRRVPRQAVKLGVAAALVMAAVVPLSAPAAATVRGAAARAAAVPASAVPSAAVPGGTDKHGVSLTGSPGIPLADPAHHSVYVPIQCAHDFCADNLASHDVDIIDTAHCTSATQHCHVAAVARAGTSPFAAALDSATHTLYVANAGSATAPNGPGHGSVSLFDTRRCNASVTTGCHTPLATIHTGGFLVSAAVDRATRTLYLADLEGNVVVVGVRRCNAHTQTGCQGNTHRVADPAGPSGVAVDEAHSTVYASNTALDSSGNTVSLVNAATCNGQRTTGCGQTPHQVTVGFSPFWDTVDQKTDTVYVANGGEDTVSIVNARTCNAHVRTGCPTGPAKTVTTGGSPQFVAVDQKFHSAFVLNSNDNTVAELNTKTCRAGSLQKCPSEARSAHAAPDHSSFYVGFPSAFALVPKTSALYLTGVGGRSTLGVTSMRHCNATATSGCRTDAPITRQSEGLMTADSATHTLYAGSVSGGRIDVFDTNRCNATSRTHCQPVGAVPVDDPGVALADVDNTTHTLYAAGFSGEVSVIRTSACNATTTTGCATAVKATIHVGQNASGLVENPATHTLYVVFGPFDTHPNRVAVVDISACTAQNTSGCAQSPVSVPVGPGANFVGLSAATNTVYVPNTGSEGTGLGHTVSVINGATCNATVHTGCSKPAATVKIGLEPFGLAVDDSSHSVYVVSNADGDAPSRLFVINSKTCNGATTAGCAGSHPSAPIGRSGLAAVVDRTTHAVYVSDFSSAGVSVVNGAICSSKTSGGCRRPAPLRAVTSQPFGIAVDPGNHTVYVASFGRGGTLSLLKAG
jgi:DNA-binding beta-propeller fold protein YncE